MLYQIKTDDASFEVVVSNTIEKMTLFHRSSTYKNSYENVVGKSIGVVFVNSKTKNKEFIEETVNDRANIAAERMKNVWKV